MRPAFSDALYYPTIDIRDTNWLKTAILFWDSISTIVPESLNHPYEQRDTQYLADIGFLRPITVNPDDRSVVGIENEVLDLVLSSEYIQAINMRGNNRAVGIYSDKMSYKVKQRIADLINGRESKGELSKQIEASIRGFARNTDREEIYYLSDEFTDAYMITLANRLCDDRSLGLITDKLPYFDIGNTVKSGKQTPVVPDRHFPHQHAGDHQLEQGILLNLIVKGLSISKDTSIDDIVSFKGNHKDELGRFRTQLARLTQDFSSETPLDIVQHEVNDLYTNELMPAFNDLKAALSGSRIKWFTETFLKVSMFSTGATSVPMALLGAPLEQAIFAGIGISLIASTISYNADRKKALRENPYSYLLSITQELT